MWGGAASSPPWLRFGTSPPSSAQCFRGGTTSRRTPTGPSSSTETDQSLGREFLPRLRSTLGGNGVGPASRRGHAAGDTPSSGPAWRRILNYLRDKSFNYPAEGVDYRWLLELRAEAEYYGLSGLTEAIDRYDRQRRGGVLGPVGDGNGAARSTAGIPGASSAAPGQAASTRATRGYTRTGLVRQYTGGLSTWLCTGLLPFLLPLAVDSRIWLLRLPSSLPSHPDEIVISVDRPVQLLGVGVCNSTTGALTAHLDVLHVDPEDYAEVETLDTSSQSFAARDGEVVPLHTSKCLTLRPDATYLLRLRVQGAESCYCEGCTEAIAAAGCVIQASPRGLADWPAWVVPAGAT